MRLTEIKEKIEEAYLSFTIDDFYVDHKTLLELPKRKFLEITGLKEESKIQDFLLSAILESNPKAIEKPLKELYRKVLATEKGIETRRKNIAAHEKKILAVEEEQKSIPTQESNLKEEIDSLEKEIEYLKPLAEKAPYNKQIDKLNKQKEDKSQEVAALTKRSKRLSSDIKRLKSSIAKEKKAITEKNAEQEGIQRKIQEKKEELEKLKADGDNLFQGEFAALQFLYEAVLHHKIAAIKERGYGYHNTGGTLMIGEKTYEITKCSSEEVEAFAVNQFNNRDIIPENWKETLNQIWAQPLPKVFGVLLVKTYWNFENYFQRAELDFSHLDKSAFLALKLSLLANQYMKTKEDIALALTGGLLASIKFRKKGDLISKFQQAPQEIFALGAIGLYKPDQRSRFEDGDGPRTSIRQILYHQGGYADSTLQIETPIGYYLILEEYVVEIRFHPAPILFGANDVVRSIPEISSKAKRKEEIRADEEERQRQEEEEEWYGD